MARRRKKGPNPLLLLLERTVLAFLCCALLVACGVAMRFACEETEKLTEAAFGWNGLVILGAVGMPVRLAGRYLACLLFGLKITGAELFRPLSGEADGVLGYVDFTWRTDRVLQLAGSFFTGILPLFLGAGVILLLNAALVPEIWRNTRKSLTKRVLKTHNPFRLLGTALGGVFRGLGSLRGFGIIRGILTAYLTASVGMYMSFTPESLTGALVGILLLLALCVVYALVSLLANRDAGAELAKAAAVILLFFLTGLFLCMLACGAALLAGFLGVLQQ